MFGRFVTEYHTLFLALHLLAGTLWIGAMAMFVLAVYPSLKQIPNEKMMIRTAIRTLRRYFFWVVWLAAISGTTGVAMVIGAGYMQRSPITAAMVSTKEAIWLFMAVLSYVAFRRIVNAKARCMASDTPQAKDNIRLVSSYLFVVMIFLGIAALYFGVMLGEEG